MRTDTQAQIDDSAISPVFARTYTVDQTTSPSLYECVRLVVVRSGSAILSTKAGKIAVGEGNVILIGPNAKCGYSPESSLTASTVFLNTQYFFDQVFWQLAGAVRCRQDAHGMAATTFVDTVHSMGIGQHRIGLLTPWLDELVSLSVDNVAGRSFPRVQALWYSILDIIMPFAPKVHMDTGSSFPVEAGSVASTGQNFSSIRDEAARVHEMMTQSVSEPWNLTQLASAVHLSPKQLTRIFVESYGMTPSSFLTEARVERMADILTATTASIAEAGRQVGWRSRSRASEAFVEVMGLTPREYRRFNSSLAAGSASSSRAV